jgi:transportin-3
VNHPEAVAAEINKHWAIFRVIFDARPWDMRTMESLCRACKYAVRTSGRYIIDTIGEMLEKIQFHYQQHHQPCFLYLSSEVIKVICVLSIQWNAYRKALETLIFVGFADFWF